MACAASHRCRRRAKRCLQSQGRFFCDGLTPWRGALFLIISATCVSGASAFTLFGFKSNADIALGQYARWIPAGSPQTPFVLTYKIDPGFMANQSGATASSARPAALAALQSWSSVTGGFISFQEETRWQATVPNADPIPPAFNGPDFNEWLANRPFFESLGIQPGWGANIEIFSRPTGFTITSETQLFTMGPGNLGFTVINITGTGVKSVDIYLNESMTWTTDAQAAANNTTSLYDIETVILHELGHAIGLDHPNEAAANAAANLDPFTFQDGHAWCSCDVMHGDYTGPKRQLTDDESGGMAFLYPPMPGDLNADSQVTLTDVSQAIAFAQGLATPTPYQLVAVDFINSNGVVDVDELTQMLMWATGSGSPPVSVQSADRGNNNGASSLAGPATITVTAAATPQDVGKGGVVSVGLSIANPDAVQVLAWECNIAFDPAEFLNPVCLMGDFPPNGLKFVSLSPGLLSVCMLSTVGTVATSGTLATLQFDIDLLQAVAAGSANFTIVNLTLVINDAGAIRNFATVAGETLVLQNAAVFASDFDVNKDGAVNLTDLFTWHQTPNDVNRDSAIDDADRLSLVNCLRRNEIADMLGVSN